MDNRFETFISRLNVINRSIQNIKNHEMEEYGLKGTHAMCLYYLRQYEDGLTSKELSQLCNEDKAAISRSLSKIESKGLIVFTDTEGKKRYRTIITLTKEGKSLCDSLYDKIEKQLEINSKGVNEEERAVFYKVFSAIAANLQGSVLDENK